MSQSDVAIAQRRFARILRWLAHGLSAQPAPIEDIMPRLERALYALRKWRPANVLEPTFMQHPGGLLSELWIRGLIEVWTRRDDPLNPLTRIDAGRASRREIQFTRDGLLTSHLTLEHDQRRARFHVNVHRPGGPDSAATIYVIGYDTHVQRSPELWPLLPGGPAATMRPQPSSQENQPSEVSNEAGAKTVSDSLDLIQAEDRRRRDNDEPLMKPSEALEWLRRRHPPAPRPASGSLRKRRNRGR